MPSAARALRTIAAEESAEPSPAAERWQVLDAKMAIATGVLALVTSLILFVWLLATLQADVNDLKEEIPPGSIRGIQSTLDQIDKRMANVERRP